MGNGTRKTGEAGMNDLQTGILAFWILMGGFIGGFLQMMIALGDNDYELSFKTAFWYAEVFYENHEDRLNSTGLTIVIVAMSLLLLPGYVLIFFITCLYKAFCKLWEAYKYVFRKE
jgi:hypothetical protein